MTRPNIHFEHYIMAIVAGKNLNLSHSEVAILRDVYLDSLPESEQLTDMADRMSTLKSAIKNARASHGVDIEA